MTGTNGDTSPLVPVTFGDTASVVFGQGAVNAAKAVKGPGVLNANRLSSDDIYTLADGSKQVLYSVMAKYSF